MPIVHSADSAWAYEPGVRLLARGTHGIPHIHTIVRSAQTTIPGFRDGKSEQGSTSHIFWPNFFSWFLYLRKGEQMHNVLSLPGCLQGRGLQVKCGVHCALLSLSLQFDFFSQAHFQSRTPVSVSWDHYRAKNVWTGELVQRNFFIRPMSLSYYLQSLLSKNIGLNQ